MRKAINPQMKLGQVDISQIEFDLKSRDEIPRLLMGLQYIWTDLELRRKALAILEEMIPRGVDTENGRPGMELWTVLVLGTLRLNCNWDYDKLKEIADNHRTVRLMLGHGVEDEEYRFPLQTMRDNVSLLTPEVLDKINQLVVGAGHNLVKKKDEKLRGRCDSFVVETDVHFPTDINLLLDAMRKVITLIAGVCEVLGWTIWRQSAYILRKLHKLYRRAQKLKKSKAKGGKKSHSRQKQIEQAHREYIKEAEEQLKKARATIVLIRSHGGIVQYIIADEIERYIRHAVNIR